MSTTAVPKPPSFTEAGYQIDLCVVGYPGKSVCHGGLGWSTIALLKGHGHVVLIDTGSFAQRALIIERLAAHNLAPANVTDVLLTHAHWDHAVNWVTFAHARVHIGGEELAWSLTEPWGTTPVPELYVRELDRSPMVRRIAAGQTVVPQVTALAAPGHTPGHLIFHLAGTERDVIFTGDAAKNRAELMSHTADMTYDPAVSRASIEAIWALWRARPGTILVPGHDVPMTLADGMPKTLAARDAGVAAWSGDTLDRLTIFDLTEF